MHIHFGRTENKCTCTNKQTKLRVFLKKYHFFHFCFSGLNEPRTSLHFVEVYLP